MRLMGTESAAEGVDSFLSALKECTAYDLSDYSESSLLRRLRKLEEDEGETLGQLACRIRKAPQTAERLVNRITVNTSELFRDPSMWLSLRREVYPLLRARQHLTVWHAACSMGQEVYSNMMLMHELELFDRTRFFASDINAQVLAAAQEGRYRYRFNLSYIDNFDRVINCNPLNYDEEIRVPYERYFKVDKIRDELRMHAFLRNRPQFRRNDLVRSLNPFYLRYDVIFCRNVIIYFNSSLQNRLFELFYRSLHPGGVLVLGAHESILGLWADRFRRVSQVYVRKD